MIDGVKAAPLWYVLTWNFFKNRWKDRQDALMEFAEVWELTEVEIAFVAGLPKSAMTLIKEAGESTVETIKNMQDYYKKSFLSDEPIERRKRTAFEIQLQSEKLNMLREAWK